MVLPAEEQKAYTLEDLLKLNMEDVEHMVFSSLNESDDFVEQGFKVYYSLKLSSLELYGNQFKVITVRD